MASFGGRPAVWVGAGLGVVLGGGLVVGFVLMAGGMNPGLAGLIVVLTALFAWRPLRSPDTSGMKRGLALGTAVGLTVLSIVAAVFTVTIGADQDEDPAELEARLRQISSAGNLQVWYLGSSYNGWDLSHVGVMQDGSEMEGDTVLDPGQYLFITYGEYDEICSDVGCGSAIEVIVSRVGSTAKVTVCLDGAAGDDRLREAADALRPLEPTDPAPKVTAQLRRCFGG